MRYYILMSLSLFLSCCVFFSCDNSDDVNDKEAPQIHGFEIMDLNLKVSDTIYLDSLCLFVGEFSDNHKLSSYRVKLIPLSEDTFRGRDSMMLITFSKGGNKIFGEKQITDTLAMRLPLTEKYKLPSEISPNTYHVIPGEYFFQVSCIDVSGNRDSIGENVILSYKKSALQNSNNQEEDNEAEES